VLSHNVTLTLTPTTSTEDTDARVWCGRLDWLRDWLTTGLTEEQILNIGFFTDLPAIY
jgi:hypothetical protein